MPMATPTDLETYLGAHEYLHVADRAGDGVADTDAVLACLAQAESVVHSYIAPWLPIAEPTRALVVATLDIAVHELALNRETDRQRERYEDAMRWLRDVASGRASLGLPEPSQRSPAAPDFSAGDRVMSRSTLRGVL